MKSGTVKCGFTLIEMIITVAIIVILVSMVIGITKRIDDQNRERLCRNELALLDNALEQFRDFGYDYKNSTYKPFNFPLDCNDDIYNSRGTLVLTLLNECSVAVSFSTGTHDINDSGSEGLYFFLSQVPDCRTTIDKIDKSLITNLDKNRTPITIKFGVGGSIVPLMRFIDPWGTTLHYDYYTEVAFPLYPVPDTKKTFPVIISAGPDRIFGTNDDIVNRQGK
jgi:prepilin-type N-terminal cleavage/methylation domain-containing protein